MAASRSSSRSRRSARKGPRGRNSTPRREPSVRVADVTRAAERVERQNGSRHDHHIAADGSRQPGLNIPSREELRSVTDAVLDETLEKKLAELHHLVGRMEALAASPYQKPHLETLAECEERPARGLTLAADGPTKDRGLVDGAGARVRRLINIVEHIRAIVGAKSELLFGAAPSESKGTALDKASSSAGVHALFNGLDHLDIQVECLEHEVVSLLGQL